MGVVSLTDCNDQQVAIGRPPTCGLAWGLACACLLALLMHCLACVGEEECADSMHFSVDRLRSPLWRRPGRYLAASHTGQLYSTPLHFTVHAAL